jgi:hypothetical protein
MQGMEQNFPQHEKQTKLYGAVILEKLILGQLTKKFSAV